MVQTITKDAEARMNKVIDSLKGDFSTMRAGVASPAILEKITFEYYGVETPLNQAANISIADARTLTVQPWDKSNLAPIEKAILKSDIGITPNNDGSIIRLTVPQLTEETRKDLVKKIKKRAEEAKVAARNVRRDANDAVAKMEKAKEISEDDSKWGVGEVQKITDNFIKQIDEITSRKEKDVMSV